MRENLLAAMCVGALALPVAACNEQKQHCTPSIPFGPLPPLPVWRTKNRWPR